MGFISGSWHYSCYLDYQLACPPISFVLVSTKHFGRILFASNKKMMRKITFHASRLTYSYANVSRTLGRDAFHAGRKLATKPNLLESDGSGAELVSFTAVNVNFDARQTGRNTGKIVG